MKILGNLIFTALGDSEIRNAIMERKAGGALGANLPGDGATGSPLDVQTNTNAAGRIVYNTDEQIYYYWNGTEWKPLATGGDASDLQQEVNRMETALGLDQDGTILPITLNAAELVGVGSPDTVTFVKVFEALDVAIVNEETARIAADNAIVAYIGSGSPLNGSPNYTSNYFVNDGDSLTAAISALDLAMAGSNQLVELIDVNTNLGSPANDLSAQESFMFRYDPTGSPYATWTLDSLTLGSLNDVADGIDLAGTEDILAFDGVQWTAITPATFANEITIADLGDVVAGSPSYSNNDLLQWNGSSWENKSAYSVISGVIALNDLSDVTAGSPATHNNGEVYLLVSDGSNYVATLLGSPATHPAQFVEAVEDIVWGSLESAGSPLASRHDSITITYDDALGEFTFSVDDVFVKNAGDTMTGNLIMGNNYVTSSAVPTADNQLTNKAYVDSLVAGLSWKDAVVVAYDSNISLTGPAPADSLGSPNYTPANGDRVLVMGQTDGTQNGIYIVNDAGAWTRATDMDQGSEFDGAAVFVQEGAWESAGFTQINTITGGSPGDLSGEVVWNQFTGGAVFTWGDGLSANGNTIVVNFGAGIAMLPNDEVGIEIHNHDNTDGALGFYSYSGSPLVASRVATESALQSGDKLHLFVDEDTLTQATGTLKVKANGITGVELNSSVAGDALALEAIAGSPAGEFELNVKVDGTTITTTGDQLQVVSVLHVESQDTGSPTGFDVNPNGTLTIVGANGITTSDNGAGTLTATLTGSTGNLSDVSADATASGQIMVSGGSPYTYTPARIQYIGQYGGSPLPTEWVVAHNLAQQWCNVTITDAAGEVIIPESIVFETSNQLRVSFNTGIAGTAIVMGVPNIQPVNG